MSLVSRRTAIKRMAALALPWGLLHGNVVPRFACGAEKERRGTADEIEKFLFGKVLSAWFPRCLDTAQGGFHENFSEDWTRQPADSKFLVYQARMTWTPAAVIRDYPEQRSRMADYVRHGLRFLGDKMWDAERGGFFDRTDAAGRGNPQRMPWKQLYSYVFGIYAAATAYEAIRERRALDLAVDAFRWLERHAHDPEHGGYYEHFTVDGRPVATDVPEREMGQGLPVIGRVGYKSMNAHIHTLEALIALRRVCDDPLLDKRLHETFQIVRDKIVRPGGHLAMFCARDFTPRDEHSSFGHELEIAYLLMEAAALLRRADDQVTRRTALALVDHSLRWGWDAAHGGFYDEGPPAAPPKKTEKIWWVQPEGMNGLLTVAEFPGTDRQRYLQAFDRTWAFFRDHMLDHRHGDCYEVVHADGSPIPNKRHKATPWKAAYHITRGLLFAIHRCRV